MRNLKRKLAAFCAAGMLFQAVSCTPTTQQAVTELIQTVGSLVISDWVNHQLGVTPSAF